MLVPSIAFEAAQSAAGDYRLLPRSPEGESVCNSRNRVDGGFICTIYVIILYVAATMAGASLPGAFLTDF